MRYLLVAAGLLLAAGINAGCEDEQTAPKDTAPVACLSVWAVSSFPECPHFLTIYGWAVCSTDEESPDSLTVRWDHESDGEWDTEYLPFRQAIAFHPDMPAIGQGAWRVTCEVRDDAGNLSQLSKEVEFAELPEAPDLIANRVEFSIVGQSDVDTVRVGQEFTVWLKATCWHDDESTYVALDHSLDGEFVRRAHVVCNNLCGGWGSTETIDSPGEYRYEFFLDATDLIQETDESNNFAQKVLIVRP